MTWRYNAARDRIQNLIANAPKIEVQNFYEEYLPEFTKTRAVLMAAGQRETQPLYELPKGRAVVVDTVQVYVAITNYDEYRMEALRETEASHAKALRFLHLHYSACDRVIENSPAQRVDFHGGRMHAVILGNGQNGVTSETIAEAFAFVRDLRYVAEQANKQLAGGDFTARFRIGIDAGPCVAINNGTGLEQEPMFLGSPANHAAKLADGDEPGLFVSDRVRAKLGRPELGSLLESRLQLDTDTFDRYLSSRDAVEGVTLGLDQSPSNVEGLLTEWHSEIRSKKVPNPTDPNFQFHYKEPPLSEIEFDKLSPSNSIRMPLASIYADLSGFTNYVDGAIAQGKIGDAVKALHVIREEFQHVVSDDFGGRKIRFIGDCVHALTAHGSSTETDTKETLLQAAKCAGGIRSSFNLCRDLLEGAEPLGLAIGVEFGPTPISRIGIRGDRSVRVASSKATSVSESVQKSCEHNETRFGPTAMKSLPSYLRDVVGTDGGAGELDFDDVSTASSQPVASVVAAPYARAHAPNSQDDTRAHFDGL
ncbi:hypothetical protein [Falsihalocynthiibacter arcticus]|uniref:Guanylate cyclase domain-containing protein n=1 Tax=Falsihalocynthiibacter arcticus TaxID=1579316 RepID=A0A126V7X0_9RHOB|nr:hypothetical protein [Falsihalocynthiibacter arcticus]AML53819.1 hypothetical protein RC74_21440 [Falsihalocynthiibacter arcticus]